MFRKIGILTTIAILALIPLLAVGFWQSWFDVSTDSKRGDWNVTFTIDLEEVEGDVDTANPPAKPPLQ